MTPRGSAGIAWLFVLLVFAAIVYACISLAPEPKSLMDQVEDAGQSIASAFR